MDTQKTRSIISQITRGTLYGLIIFLASAVIVEAYTRYSAGALLQPGDVTSSIIRDGAITYLDLQSEILIGKQHLGTSTDNGLIYFSMNEGATTSLNFNFATSSLFMGLGSSTPGAMLSVGGTGIFSNNLYTGNFTATGTTNFGNNSFDWPTDANASGTALMTNGAGTLSWNSPVGGMDELCDTTIPAATTSAICQDFAARDFIRVIFLFNDNAAEVGTPHLRFNADTAANYASAREAEGTADSTDINASGIIVLSTAGDGITVCDIMNFADTNKSVWCVISANNGATAAPQKRVTSGTWANTARIHTVQFIETGGAAFVNAGSRIIVQGSAEN